MMNQAGLTPEERSMCRQLGIDQQAFAADKAADGATLRAQPEAGAAGLSPEERDMCRQMAIDEAEMVAMKVRELGASAPGSTAPSVGAEDDGAGIARAAMHHAREALNQVEQLDKLCTTFGRQAVRNGVSLIRTKWAEVEARLAQIDALTRRGD